MDVVRNTKAIFKRELASYFESPVAYVFLVVFLVLVQFLTFFIGNYYEVNQADPRGFFFWHPWLFLILVPAASMRLWSEERRTGTIETLLTLPISLFQALMGKFLAAWFFIGLAVVLTFPIVLATAYLGAPDKGVIVGGYLGSLLLAGTCLSVGMFTSALTRNQVISFVLSVVICLFLLLAGWPPVTDMFVKWPLRLAELIASWGVISGSYLVKLLLAGICLSVGAFTYALTRNQIISSILSVVIFLLLLLAGWAPVNEMFVKGALRLVELVASFSFMSHYYALQRGVIDLRDLAYFVSAMLFMLVATHQVIENRKAA